MEFFFQIGIEALTDIEGFYKVKKYIKISKWTSAERGMYPYSMAMQEWLGIRDTILQMNG